MDNTAQNQVLHQCRGVAYDITSTVAILKEVGHVRQKANTFCRF